MAPSVDVLTVGFGLLGSAPALVAFAHPGPFLDDPGWAVLAVAMLNAGNLAGRLLSGPIADRWA